MFVYGLFAITPGEKGIQTWNRVERTAIFPRCIDRGMHSAFPVSVSSRFSSTVKSSNFKIL